MRQSSTTPCSSTKEQATSLAARLSIFVLLLGCGASEGESGSASAEAGETDSDASASADSESAGEAGEAGDGDSATSDSTTNTPTSSTGDGDGDGDGDGIWTPSPGTSWHWQLTGQVASSASVQMVDADLFDLPQATIDALKAEGIVVICYFSAGSHEDWRPDADDFPPAAIGDPLDGWPGERWIDHRDAEVRAVMSARMDLAVQKGCDGVEPDNVDGYTNNSGFDLSGEDQLNYNLFLAYEAHGRGLSIGLKNDLDQVGELVEHFNWALNEECQSYDECDLLDPFIDAGKAVFHVEYVDTEAEGPDAAAGVCPPALAKQFSTLVKTWDLDAWGIDCSK